MEKAPRRWKPGPRPSGRLNHGKAKAGRSRAFWKSTSPPTVERNLFSLPCSSWRGEPSRAGTTAAVRCRPWPRNTTGRRTPAARRDGRPPPLLAPTRGAGQPGGRPGEPAPAVPAPIEGTRGPAAGGPSPRGLPSPPVRAIRAAAAGRHLRLRCWEQVGTAGVCVCYYSFLSYMYMCACLSYSGPGTAAVPPPQQPGVQGRAFP